MSLSWLERVRVALHPGGLDGAVVRRGDGKLLRHETVAAPAPLGWEEALELLPEMLARLQVRRRETHVVLSNAWAHYLVLPWQPALNTEDEWVAYARHSHMKTYGNVAESWRIRLSMQGYGQPVLSCAVEEDFSAGITSALLAAGAHPATIAPFHHAACQRFWPQLGKGHCWLAQAEPGRLLLSRMEEGRTVYLVSRRIDQATDADASGVLIREISRCAFDHDGTALFYHAAGRIPVPQGLPDGIEPVILGSSPDTLNAGLKMALCA